MPALERTLTHYVQPEALGLSTHAMSMLWLPQLQRCAVAVSSVAQMALLNSRLSAGSVQQVSQLRSLVVHDFRSLLIGQHPPPSLSGLPHLPSLCKLVRRAQL